MFECSEPEQNGPGPHFNTQNVFEQPQAKSAEMVLLFTSFKNIHVGHCVSLASKLGYP